MSERGGRKREELYLLLVEGEGVWCKKEEGG